MTRAGWGAATTIDIVGTGVGPATLTRQAAESIAQADVLIGSPRLIQEYAREGQQVIVASRPEQVLAAIRETEVRRITVLMSGDVGFHSGATSVFAGLCDRPSGTGQDCGHPAVRLVPGLSTPVVFAARLGIPWEDARLVSCHAPDVELVSSVRRHHRTVALTGGNVHILAQALIDAGYADLDVWAGEDLGLTQEKVTRTTVAGLLERTWSSLTILMIENTGWDDRVRTGIPDEEFTRGEIPMTKSEVRAYVMSRLALKPTDMCYDIGCGTGSVTVEMALSAYSGHVWAVDTNPKAIELTRANCHRFHIGNVTVVRGSAPEALTDWPAADAVFIGGTSGNMDAIVGAVLARNPRGRIVITAIAIESVAAAVTALSTHGIEPELTQLSVARSRAAGGLHLLMGLNPVTVITGRTHG